MLPPCPPPPPPYRNQQRPAPRSHHFCGMLGCRGDRVGALGCRARNFGTTLGLGWFHNELVANSPRGAMEGDGQRREWTGDAVSLPGAGMGQRQRRGEGRLKKSMKAANSRCQTRVSIFFFLPAALPHCPPCQVLLCFTFSPPAGFEEVVSTCAGGRRRDIRGRRTELWLMKI